MSCEIIQKNIPQHQSGWCCVLFPHTSLMPAVFFVSLSMPGDLRWPSQDTQRTHSSRGMASALLWLHLLEGDNEVSEPVKRQNECRVSNGLSGDFVFRKFFLEKKTNRGILYPLAFWHKKRYNSSVLSCRFKVLYVGCANPKERHVASARRTKRVGSTPDFFFLSTYVRERCFFGRGKVRLHGAPLFC